MKAFATLLITVLMLSCAKSRPGTAAPRGQSRNPASVNLLSKAKWTVSEEKATPFINANDIYQDGSSPMYRDKNGTLWAMSGHTHLGHIGMFKGSCLDDLKEAYPIKTNFKTGAAGEAFDGVRYPEGVMSRGSIWPFGLYICPVTNRFFCFFHNETGWNGKGTGYTIYGLKDGEPDFRHIGLMHSDDSGRTWDFDRWVLTAEQVGYSELYHPDGIERGGQPAGEICCGAGDFSIFIEPEGDYIYLFYNLLYYDSFKKDWSDCSAYVARTRKRTDGCMGDMVKYFNGSFCEPGNLGKASQVVENVWHPQVLYSKSLDAYILAGVVFDVKNNRRRTLEMRTSRDLIHWSEPFEPAGNGDEFHRHYFSVVSTAASGPHNVVENHFSVLGCDNGTDVKRHDVTFER